MSAAAEGKNDATPHHGSKGVLHFEDGKAIRHLMWEREDHWFVLTRRYGSIWPDGTSILVFKKNRRNRGKGQVHSHIFLLSYFFALSLSLSSLVL